MCFSVAGAGIFTTLKRAKRTNALKGFCEYFGVLAAASVGFLGDMSALLKKSALPFDKRFSFPAALTKLYGETGDIEKAWKDCVQQYAECLTDAERTMLLDFSSAFDGFSKSEFYGRCKKSEQDFSEYFAAAEEKRKKNEKLTVAFSSLLAALMFIILI